MSNVKPLQRPPAEIAEEDKTHWRKLINPAYLGAYSLIPGRDMTVRILSVSRENVKGVNGKGEECTVARLVNQKPFIVNRTNAKSIARLYGPYIEDWAGKAITLFASKTKAEGGEMVECLRVRPTVMKDDAPKPPLSTARFKAALASVASQERTSDFVRERFTLTEAQEAELKALEAPNE